MGKDADNYLDDFLFAALLAALCDGQIEIFLDICKAINFPVSLDKTFWSCHLLTFLGFLINTVEQTISIPIEKVQKAVTQLQVLYNSNKTTVLKLQQMTGILNFLCRAIVPRRAYTRRFYTQYANPQLKQNHHVQVDSEMKLDATVWLKLLEEPNSFTIFRPFMDFSKKLVADEIEFFTDASGAEHLGFGCYFGGLWTDGRWENKLITHLNPSIGIFGVICTHNSHCSLGTQTEQSESGGFL